MKTKLDELITRLSAATVDFSQLGDREKFAVLNTIKELHPWAYDDAVTAALNPDNPDLHISDAEAEIINKYISLAIAEPGQETMQQRFLEAVDASLPDVTEEERASILDKAKEFLSIHEDEIQSVGGNVVSLLVLFLNQTWGLLSRGVNAASSYTWLEYRGRAIDWARWWAKEAMQTANGTGNADDIRTAIDRINQYFDIVESSEDDAVLWSFGMRLSGDTMGFGGHYEGRRQAEIDMNGEHEALYRILDGYKSKLEAIEQ